MECRLLHFASSRHRKSAAAIEGKPDLSDHIERAQEHALVIAPISDQVEAGDAIQPTGDRFPVDDAAPGSQTCRFPAGV
jgi:hypothetical protein